MGIPQEASAVLVVKHTFLEFVDQSIGEPRARCLTDSALEAADSASWPNALRSDLQTPIGEPEARPTDRANIPCDHEALESKLTSSTPASPSKPRLLGEPISPGSDRSSPLEVAASQVRKSPTLGATLRSPPMTPVLAPVQENPAAEVGSQPLSQGDTRTTWTGSDGCWVPAPIFMLTPAAHTQDMSADQLQKAIGNQRLHMFQEQALGQLQRPDQHHYGQQQRQQQQQQQLSRHQLQRMQQQQQEHQQKREKVADRLHFDKLVHGAFGNNSPAPDQDDEGSGGIRTTVMLRNLPNCYTRSKLLELLDSEGFAGRYDFVYLPIDFSSTVSLGYAFVDLISPEDADNFVHHFRGYSRWDSASEKICTVNWSNPHQGLQQHIDRYRNSPVMHSAIPDEWKPIIIIDGARVPFPVPTKIIKAPKLRNRPAEAATAIASAGSS